MLSTVSINASQCSSVELFSPLCHRISSIYLYIYSLCVLICTALFRKYNKRGHGVDFASFLAIAADVALLRSRFEVADTDRDGWVRINLNNLIEMTSDM